MGEKPSSGDEYVTDTQALVWYLTSDRRLGQRASDCFKKAESRQLRILIPVTVLFECLWIIKKHRIKISNIDEVLLRLEANEDIFPIVPIDKEAFDRALEIANSINIHDLMIVGLTLSKEATLITKDEAVRKANILKTLW